jgi:hypothetical protein
VQYDPTFQNQCRTGKTQDFMSEEEVHFYLGINIAGPLAYNIKPIDYAEVAI